MNENIAGASSLDEYNPFAVDAESQKNKTTLEPPPYSALADLERRQKELDARSKAIEDREQELRQTVPLDEVKNWPPFPRFCPIKSCYRQDFDTDFTEITRPVAKHGYAVWLFYTLVNLINIIVVLGYVFTRDIVVSGVMLGSGLIFVFIVTPLSVILWYRPVYRALKTDSSFSFFLFFIVFSIQILLMIVQCLGISYFGSCGWIIAIETFTRYNKVVGIMMFITASLYTIVAITAIFLLFRVHTLYRNSGASFSAAKREMATGVISDPSVRSAATNIGAAAAREAVYNSSATTGR